jgi:hypothetical protein
MSGARDWNKSYFHSGWMFLVPYVVAYGVYAGMGWPANRLPAGDGSAPHTAVSLVPSLLHVYWLLHVVHVALGVAALRAWLKKSSGIPQAEGWSSVICRLVPWGCLALLFWIPGIYIEWPSDPWEHLRRINEWRALDVIGEHSAWHKWTYFLAYSITSPVLGDTQIEWLRIFCAVIALLLCWQYFRLATAVGLTPQASMVFVLLQAVLMGNSGFSFYRYYALSSSIIAQLGAVVLLRQAVEFAHAYPGRQPAGQPGWFPNLARAGFATSLISFSHPQALGMAFLGLGAVAASTFLRWPRWVCVASIAALLVGNVVTIVAARKYFPAEIDALRQPGWFAPWYGFHVFAPWSLAGQRALTIIGLAGLVNLGVAVAVARYRPLVAWLTLTPIGALAMPMVAVPFALVLLKLSPSAGVLTFSRLLLAIPAGLAIATAVDYARSKPATSAFGRGLLPVAALAAFALVIALPSPRGRAPNPSWNFLAVPPADLALKPLREAWSHVGIEKAAAPSTRLLASSVALDVLAAFHPIAPHNYFRTIEGSVPHLLANTRRALESAPALPPAHPLAGWLPAKDVVVASVPASGRAQMAPDAGHDLTGDEWVVLSGERPARLRDPDGRTSLATPRGAPVRLATAKGIPIDPGRRYELEIRVRQRSGSGRNYLGAGWYKNDDRHLASNAFRPQGAGQPIGWINGAMSHYGLVGQSGPSEWTAYTYRLGPGEDGVIPSVAEKIRVVALLNDNAAPDTVVELGGVFLRPLPEPARSMLVLSRPGMLFSAGSQMAMGSLHWNPRKVSIDLGASRESLEAFGF